MKVRLYRPAKQQEVATGVILCVAQVDTGLC